LSELNHSARDTFFRGKVIGLNFIEFQKPLRKGSGTVPPPFCFFSTPNLADQLNQLVGDFVESLRINVRKVDGNTSSF